ncbi:hypothetical protein ACFL45_08040 [Candidatus Neomarinimicrobiota bacterium]
MSSTYPTLQDLVTFRRLKVGPIIIERRRMKAPYTLTHHDGRVTANEFIYTYDERVFDSKVPESINLASMLAVQVAMNYGLFCEELEFDGLYDQVDQRFIRDMVENTSREIYVNKFLSENEFLLAPFNALPTQRLSKYTAARIGFSNTAYTQYKLHDSQPDCDHNRYLILSSGGKDSLLSYGVMKELGKDVHPVFINESGRHWFTAINAYRYLRDAEPNTARVWCNSDRVFAWMLRQMPFIRQDFADVRADIYPIRLWTVAVFLFGVLPLAHQRRVGRILIGNEYDTTLNLDHHGITHYAALYDQSKYFDNALTRYYQKKGWGMYQFSILRSLSELLILAILVNRYPHLQQQQVSCHAAHERDGRIYPCGNCEKCRRIVGMLQALDADPTRCGYTSNQIVKALKSLEQKKVKQLGMDAAYLYHLLLTKSIIARNAHTERLAKPFDFIMKLRFDSLRSDLQDMPSDIREELISIFLEYAGSAVVQVNRRWIPFDVLNAEAIHKPYRYQNNGKES